MASKGRAKVEFNFLLTLRGSSYVVNIHLREKLSPVGDESDYREALTYSRNWDERIGIRYEDMDTHYPPETLGRYAKQDGILNHFFAFLHMSAERKAVGGSVTREKIVFIARD